MRTNETKSEMYEIKKWEEKIKREDLRYKTNNYTYDFQQFETIRCFNDDIYIGKVNISEAKMNESNLLKNLIKFYNISNQEK